MQVELWVNEQEGNPSASRTHSATGLAVANAKQQVSILSGGHVRPQAVVEARWGEIRSYLRTLRYVSTWVVDSGCRLRETSSPHRDAELPEAHVNSNRL